MLRAVTPLTRMIFIANPNNPTGTLLDKHELKDFLRNVPSNVLVVLDEAYDEYLPEAYKSESVQWLTDFDNLIISRTFSMTACCSFDDKEFFCRQEKIVNRIRLAIRYRFIL